MMTGMAGAIARYGDADERRGDDRRSLDDPSTLRLVGTDPVDVRFRDFSRHGFRFETSASIAVGALVRVGLAGSGVAEARIVRQGDAGYGCIFLTPLSRRQEKQAFGRQPVIAIAFRPAIGETARSTMPGKWSATSRLVFLFASAIALWAVIGGIIRLI